jgi:hypothetical protein
MRMDIGLHLLGGDPLGFYRQPRAVQIDLIAYWHIMNDSESPWRWASFGPMRLGDLARFSARTGLSDVISGCRAWLVGRGGIKFKGGDGGVVIQREHRAMLHANADRVGASKKARNFWLGA